VRRALLLSLTAAILGDGFHPVVAQQSSPAFDVVSIRRNHEGGPGISGWQGATYTGRATSVHRMILFAYHDRLSEWQLDGEPGWLETDRFDIVAKASVELTTDGGRAMMRALLEDRFGLVLRREQRQGDVYVLTRIRPDGDLGPDLHRAPETCAGEDLDPLEKLRRMPRPSSGANPSFMEACQTIDNLASSLAGRLSTSVINQTGLAGRWDYVLSHSNLQPGPVSSRLPLDDRPGLFTAVEEQFGLRLERQRGLTDSSGSSSRCTSRPKTDGSLQSSVLLVGGGGPRERVASVPDGRARGTAPLERTVGGR
jgi:uncharacterized protein (TIGR03435 family)